MKSKTILIAAMLSASVIPLGGCQSLDQMLAIPIKSESVSCSPVAPQLEWYEVAEGGVYYPKRSFTNLQLYIQELNDCIDYYQTRPG